MLIQGNTITQTVKGASGYSPISGNGPGGTNRNLVIRGNTIDQGPAGVAHFGIEVWDNTGLVIESNTLKGASALISIPRSDGAIIRGNTFDLTQAFWGVEIADADNVQVLDNVGAGNSSTGSMWRAFVQLHPGSGTVNGTVIKGNRLTNFPALVNAPPAPTAGSIVTDNCLASVGRVFWGAWGGTVTLARNGPC
jgi:hypothetical protein